MAHSFYTQWHPISAHKFQHLDFWLQGLMSPGLAPNNVAQTKLGIMILLLQPPQS